VDDGGNLDPTSGEADASALQRPAWPDFGRDLASIISMVRWPAGLLFEIDEVVHWAWP
jgi:hypothetical protein